MGIELNLTTFPRTNDLGKPTLAQKIEKDSESYYFVKDSPEKYQSVQEAIDKVNPPENGFVTLYRHVPKHDARDALRHAGGGAVIGFGLGAVALRVVASSLEATFGLGKALLVAGGFMGIPAVAVAVGYGLYKYNQEHSDFEARIWNTLPPWA